MMNDIFKGLINKGYVAVYMDDILVYTHMIEHHWEVATRVLDVLQKHWLYLKVEKCTFECSMVEYLGLVLLEEQVEMDPVKIARVRDWPTLKNVTEVQSFVGFVNFYHRFILEFTHVASPLHQLTKKVEPWQWTQPEEAAFRALKSLITSALILILPDQNAHFQLETNASGYATRVICPSSVMMRSGTPLALCLRVSAQQNVTMPSMTRNCYQLYVDLRSGDTY